MQLTNTLFRSDVLLCCFGRSSSKSGAATVYFSKADGAVRAVEKSGMVLRGRTVSIRAVRARRDRMSL